MTQFHWPGFDSLAKLSAEETAELAARVADLTKAGLPLASGLRAMADELSGRRSRRVLHALADRLDAGEDLASAMESQGRRLPLCLRGIVLAGLRSGRLAEALEEYADLRRSRLELRRRLWFSLAYPFFLLCVLALMAVMARFCVVVHFKNLFDDFGMSLPVLTELVINVSLPFAWFMVALVALFALIPLLLAVSPGIRWIWPALYKIPMIGPLLRWGNLSQFSRLLALLLEQQVPLPDALRLTAAGLHDPNLARGCRRVAEDVERGQPLYESMDRRRQFPAGMIPLVEWGQRTPALPDAFRATTEMFEGRTLSQGSLLEAVLLPFMFMFIVTFVGLLVISMMMPLLKLITTLSS